ncbi:DUF4983 domain-containing protein [Pedobacter sp. UBA5917]|jgi:hypothetical protein|uniref:DUF4983 domain-containing protein n=1 Tax=Pedobacter sp. UBA5917 TaxID=1947061 RepID=UPI0025CE8621|nr:DUF4983 domain-containing protein [Pedobacter sp. UBA5917]
MKKGFTLTIKYLSFALVSGLFLMSLGCNKDFDNTLPTSFKNDTLGVGDGSKRVLYIILDGVKGSVLKSLAPTNLTQITAKSIYSYDGLADYQTNEITNAGGWANMITGVDVSKHKVNTENFSGFDSQATPTLFSRVKSVYANTRTVSFAATAAFNDNLAADATVKQSFADDAAVKTAAINEINTNSPSILVAQFHSADAAGGNNYSTSNTTYTNAINTLDGYIGEILTALRARKTFGGENWMVIVASNKAGGPSGAANSANPFVDASRNTFVAFYNPKFSRSQVALDPNNLPYSGTAPNLVCTNTSRNDLVANNTTIGNFGTSGDYTLLLKVKANHSSVGGYPPFIGKTANFANGNAGWVLFTNGDAWNFKANGTQQFGAGTRNFRDGLWHTIAIRIYTENGTRYVTGYQDGKIVGGPFTQTNGSWTANMTSTTPFTVGNIVTTESTVSAIDVLIQDVLIYNVALSENDIINNMRKTKFSPTDAYYSNIVGYWPLNEGQGSTAAEKTGKGPLLNFVGTNIWKPYGDLAPNVSASVFTTAAYTAVPNGVDIPLMIYNWLNIAVPANWNLMGRFYTPPVNLPTN